jgi:UDP:flavonoid glycosyltransferase YjiC (YdhE family)
VWEIIRNPAYKEAAQRIQQSFEESGGATTAANLLEELAPLAFHRNRYY